MMSLPFILFACGIGSAWARQRGIAVGFWLIGLIVMLIVFRIHATGVLGIEL